MINKKCSFDYKTGKITVNCLSFLLVIDIYCNCTLKAGIFSMLSSTMKMGKLRASLSH